MKLRKVLASVVAAATAVTALTTAASAYNFVTEDPFTGTKDGFDLGLSWANFAEVPAEEFAALTADSLVKITYKANDLDTDGNYWIIKPVVNDGSSAWVDPDKVNTDLEIGSDGTGFVVQTDATTISFKIAPSLIDSVKASGLGFVGHSVTLEKLEVVNDTPAATEPDNSGDVTTADGNTNSGNDTPKDPVNTGIEGIAVLMGVGALAAAAVVFSKKRK